ncbi:hypothetical protein PAENIP36_30830 [Paenibacillus sp. P36]
MVYQDQQIFRVNSGRLWGTFEKVFWVLDYVLVNRCIAGYHNNQGFTVSPSSPTCLLPGAGDASGISGHNTNLQLAYVYA